MELNFVTGRAGSGKSQYCIENIAGICNKNYQDKVFLIVPEQFTVQAEKRMLEKIVSGGVIENEVLSFKRLSHKVLNEYGGVNKKVLNVSGRSMLLAKSFKMCEKKLSYYKNFTETPWNVDKMMTVLTEFIRYGVDEESVLNVVSEIKDTPEKADLALKLQEIATIYGTYRKLLNVEYMDELRIHKVLMEKLEKFKPFKDAVIWIDEFSGFTTLELEIIESLIKQCKSVNICLLADKKQKQLFKGSFATMLKIKAIAENLGCPVSENILPGDNLPRFKENEALGILESEFGNYPYKTYDKVPENIEIFSCRDVHREVYNSALLIRKLCKEEGLRFKDISVITRDIDRYRNVIDAIYPLMDIKIKYFVDDKTSLDTHPITSLILDALDIVATNFRYESVFAFLKSGYFTDDWINVSRLENEVLKRGIKGRKAWSNPLIDPECEEIRKNFIEHMNVLIEGLESSVNYRDAVGILCKFIDGLNITVPDCSDNKEKEEELIKVSKMISEVFSQLCDFLGDEKCGRKAANASELKFLLKNGFSKYMIGAIPEDTDFVHVGVADRSRTHEVKALIVLGANEGVFPASFEDNGILSDEERNVLQAEGVTLSDDMRTRSFLEQFLVYTTVSTPGKYLYISYALEADGNVCKPSWLVRRVKNILPKVKITECKEKVVFSGKKLKGASPFVEGTYLSEELAERLFASKDSVALSVSSMENYIKCPYKFFLQNGIKVYPREEFSVETTDTGNFLHVLLELGTKKVLASEEKSLITEKQCEQIIDSVTQEALGIVNRGAMIATAKNRFVTDRLKKFASKALMAVAKQCSSSGYIPGGFEVSFGQKNKDSLAALEVKGKDGSLIRIQGKIDRYDYWEHDGKRYYRIIDYKSYGEDIEPWEVEAGCKMQLITYADALTETNGQDGLTPCLGGVFYQQISTSRTDKGDYRLKGLFFDDDESIQAMVGDGGGGLDKKALDPDKNIKGCTRVPEGGFEYLKEKTEENIRNIDSDIKAGKIPVKPMASGERSPCEYCEYGNICGFCVPVKKRPEEDSDTFFSNHLKKKAD